MGKTWMLVLCLAAVPALADSPLDAAAKKEQERREKAKKSGAPTKTITEQELAAAKGTVNSLGGETTASPAPSRTAPAPSRTAPPSSREAASDDDEEEKKEGAAPGAGGSARGEDYWRGRVGEARARVERAQRRVDNIQAMIRLGQPVGKGEGGRAVIYSQSAMKNMADEAAAELAAAQAALETVLDEGRRAGALPGWLR